VPPAQKPAAKIVTYVQQWGMEIIGQRALGRAISNAYSPSMY
jgi:hypothetical protein